MKRACEGMPQCRGSEFRLCMFLKVSHLMDRTCNVLLMINENY